MQGDWYHSFFQGITLDLWDRACSARQTESEIRLLERLLDPFEGAELLDVPCGLGRHLVALGRKGYRVTGLDLSREAIGVARTRAGQEGVSCELHSADMRSLPWISRFDGAYCLGNSFGYFDLDGTQAFLCAAARALKPGAAFVLETGMAAESILPALDEKNWYQAGDILMLVENAYVVNESRLDTVYTFVSSAGVESRSAHHHIFTVAEILRLLKNAGLATEALYGSCDLEPFDVGCPDLYVLCRKIPETRAHMP